MAGSSTETLPTSSDSTYDVGHMKAEEDTYMPHFEEVIVKTEKVIYSEEEEEDIDTQEEENVALKEEVSFEDTVK
jgi:hypothetical protein